MNRAQIQHTPQRRRGTLLIVVAALLALMASVTVAFLLNMRKDAEENAIVLGETQARLMLVAGCNYIMEASRLGYDDPATPAHEEAFGWVDVRDGKLGPKIQAVGDDDHLFPIGHVARCDMFMWTTPPFATKLAAAPNAISTVEGADDFGMPYLRNPDPVRGADDWASFKKGNSTPITNSQNMSWFRVCRIGPARFVITCGSGASRGFRDWPEVLSTPGAVAIFGNDPSDRGLFDTLMAAESRLWYQVEWSAATNDNNYHCIDSEHRPDHYGWYPLNFTQGSDRGTTRSQSNNRNCVGTIRFVQRLRGPPALW